MRDFTYSSFLVAGDSRNDFDLTYVLIVSASPTVCMITSIKLVLHLSSAKPYLSLVLQQILEISGAEGISLPHKDIQLTHLLSEALHPLIINVKIIEGTVHWTETAKHLPGRWHPEFPQVFSSLLPPPQCSPTGWHLQYAHQLEHLDVGYDRLLPDHCELNPTCYQWESVL